MKKIYRSIDFNDERKWKSKHRFDDVFQVGFQKAVGYLCWIPGKEDNELKEYIFNLLNMGLFEPNKLVLVTNSSSDSHKNFPILYVGDVAMMQPILDKNKKILIASNWSTDAKEVFYKIAYHDVLHNENDKLYHVICELFNSWCLWCEPSIKKDNKFFSVDPYDPELDNR